MTFHLSKWIAAQLNTLTLNTGLVLKDTTELLNILQSENMCEKIPKHSKNIIIVTADIEALYPNIDINRGIQNIQLDLEEIIWETEAKQTLLLKGLHIILTKGFMTFDKTVKGQNNGTAMGSPMAPPYANIFIT